MQMKIRDMKLQPLIQSIIGKHKNLFTMSWSRMLRQINLQSTRFSKSTAVIIEFLEIIELQKMIMSNTYSKMTLEQIVETSSRLLWALSPSDAKKWSCKYLQSSRVKYEISTCITCLCVERKNKFYQLWQCKVWNDCKRRCYLWV